MGCCASIIGPVVWIHAGASVLKPVPVFASVLQPLAKEGFMDASGATRCFGRAAVIRFYSTAEGRSATVQRDAPHLSSPEPLPQPAPQTTKKKG